MQFVDFTTRYQVDQGTLTIGTRVAVPDESQPFLHHCPICKTESNIRPPIGLQGIELFCVVCGASTLARFIPAQPVEDHTTPDSIPTGESFRYPAVDHTDQATVLD